MSDPVWTTLIVTIGGIVTTFLNSRSNKKTRHTIGKKVDDVHTLVNDRSTQQDNKIAALKLEVGRLNENADNSTPASGGTVNMQHGQVVVSKEPEIK